MALALGCAAAELVRFLNRVVDHSAKRLPRSVVIPMLGASFATASVLLATSVVRLYDLAVAMTNGGPGLASEVPAKFVMDHLFERGNLGLATAAATSMLITVAAVVAPWLYWQARQSDRRLAA